MHETSNARRKRSNLEIADEVTLFYKDYRNISVCWGDAREIAGLTIEGDAPSEAEIDALRSEDAKEGCT